MRIITCKQQASAYRHHLFFPLCCWPPALDVVVGEVRKFRQTQTQAANAQSAANKQCNNRERRPARVHARKRDAHSITVKSHYWTMVRDFSLGARFATDKAGLLESLPMLVLLRTDILPKSGLIVLSRVSCSLGRARECARYLRVSLPALDSNCLE